ncbi:hypothetical protein ACHAQA_006551 [Verticillium albo-atrum]
MAPTPSPWCTLPPEIRLMIYEYCVSAKLLLVSRQIFKEAKPVFWGTQTLVLHTHPYGPGCHGRPFRTCKATETDECACPNGGGLIGKDVTSRVRSVRAPLPEDFHYFPYDYTPSEHNIQGPRLWRTSMTLEFKNVTVLDVGTRIGMLESLSHNKWQVDLPHLQTVIAWAKKYSVAHFKPNSSISWTSVNIRLEQRLRDVHGNIIAADSCGPADSNNPTNSANPADPANPASTEDSADSEDSASSEDSDNPEDPDNPEDTDNPEDSANSAGLGIHRLRAFILARLKMLRTRSSGNGGKGKFEFRDKQFENRGRFKFKRRATVPNDPAWNGPRSTSWTADLGKKLLMDMEELSY